MDLNNEAAHTFQQIENAIATETPQAEEEPRDLATGKRPLLVVDENELNRDMLVRRLRRLGYETIQAENGAQAWEKLASAPIDLILLDVMMPGTNGFEFLDQIKREERWKDIPVIILAAAEEADRMARGIGMGAEDYLSKPFNPVLLKARISASLEKRRLHELRVSHMEQLTKEKQRSDALVHAVIPLGIALLAEKDFNRLLEKILLAAMSFCNADAGTLYLRIENDRLKFVIMRNYSLNIAMGGTTGKEIPFAPVPMYDAETGQPNHHYVVTHAALTGNKINIPDAYQAEGFDFSGTKAFDEATGYRSASFLTVPLTNNANDVIGVLQLINAQTATTNQVVPFDAHMQTIIESLASLAAVALEAYVREQSLRKQIEELRVEIDQAKKARQVADITETDYFRGLQEKARNLRANSRTHNT